MYLYLIREDEFFELTCAETILWSRQGASGTMGETQRMDGFSGYDEAFDVLAQQARDLVDEGFETADPAWWLAIGDVEELTHRLSGIAERIADGQLERDEVAELVGEVLDDCELPEMTAAFAATDPDRFLAAVSSQLWMLALANAMDEE